MERFSRPCFQHAPVLGWYPAQQQRRQHLPTLIRERQSPSPVAFDKPAHHHGRHSRPGDARVLPISVASNAEQQQPLRHGQPGGHIFRLAQGLPQCRWRLRLHSLCPCSIGTDTVKGAVRTLSREAVNVGLRSRPAPWNSPPWFADAGHRAGFSGNARIDRPAGRHRSVSSVSSVSSVRERVELLQSIAVVNSATSRHHVNGDDAVGGRGAAAGAGVRGGKTAHYQVCFLPDGQTECLGSHHRICKTATSFTPQTRLSPVIRSENRLSSSSMPSFLSWSCASVHRSSIPTECDPHGPSISAQVIDS